MADHIFLIHGMGDYGADWADETVKQLKAFCKDYSKPGNLSFEERYKFIPLNYSKVISDLLQAWAKNAAEVTRVTQIAGAKPVKQLLSWLDNPDDFEEDFFWTHAFDVMLYYCSPMIRDAVKVNVARQMFENLPEEGDGTWSIIAHSLGTAVAHDTLQAWATQELFPGGGTLDQHRRPFMLQMIANVSRILETSPQVFDSKVRPGEACLYYHSAYHPLDPFTRIRPFTPVAWPEPEHRGDFLLSQLPLDFIQEANIHGLEHYLRHPDVVVPLLRRLSGKGFVPVAMEKKYREAFKPHGELTDKKLVELRKKIEDAGVKLPENWMALLIAWQRWKELKALGGDPS